MLEKIISILGGVESTKYITTLIINLCAVICVCATVIVLFYWWSETKKEQSIYNFNHEKKAKSNYITDVLFKELTKNMKRLEDEKGKPEGWAQRMTIIIVIGCLSAGGFLLFYKQVFLGVSTPVAMLMVITKISELIVDSNAEKIQAALPSAIDSIIRSMSKHDDLPGILYDASSSIEEPLKTMLQQMSVKMLNSSIQGTLNKFMEDNKNIWIYALSFTLLNYVEDASKDDTVNQLRKLKGVIDKENKDKNANKAEKKMTVAVNYVLCVFAVLGLIGNLMANPAAKNFFFASLGGIVCFVVGVILVIVSVFSNLLLGKGKI